MISNETNRQFFNQSINMPRHSIKFSDIAQVNHLKVKNSSVPQILSITGCNNPPISKTASPTCPADFRPISITPILSRLLERCVVRNFLYPSLDNLPTTHSHNLAFNDQYAFRTTGSPTSALIALFSDITTRLVSEPYVVCLDFSKAFDTVRHSTLFSKLARLIIPDHIYNWLLDFYSGRSHCTRFNEQTSTPASIQSSVV